MTARQRILAGLHRTRRLGRIWLSLVVATGLVPLGAAPATAVCGVDPDDLPLTIRQMIRRGETGDPPFDVVFLGRVREIRTRGSAGAT